MQDAPTFTVLAPVTRPPDLLMFAIHSVLRQSRQDFELFIICDGAPTATAEAARRFEAEDQRVRAFVHPKGERHGEAYRHLALQEARGRIVCQIGDDDLWFPDHLADVDTLMDSTDFGNTVPMFLRPDGSPMARLGDLADPGARRLMSEGRFNLFGPTTVAYLLETYRRLPIGWSPAPEESWTDLWMWRKFLALPGLRTRTGFSPSTLEFPAALRRDWTLEQRRDEIGACAEAIRDKDLRDRLWREALAAAAQRLVALQSDAAELKAVGRTLVTALEDAEAALIAIAGEPGEPGRLARAALDRLPDRAWRARPEGWSPNPPAAA